MVELTHVQQPPVAPLQAVFLPDPVFPARGRLAFYHLTGAPPRPETLGVLGVSTERMGRARLALPGQDGLPAVSDVPIALADLEDALDALAGVNGRAQATDSVRAWALAARLAGSLVSARALVPALIRHPPADTATVVEPDVVAQWRVDTQDPAVADARRRVAATLPLAGHALVRPQSSGPERIWRAEALLGAFLDAVADLAVRRGGDPPRPGRPRARLLPWTARWAEALIDPSDPTVPLRDDADELVAGVAAWWRGQFEEGPGGSLELRLAAPAAQDGDWRLDLGVRTDNGEHVPAAEIWSGASLAPDGDGARGSSAAGLQRALLRGLARAARLFAPLDTVLDAAAPEGLDLDLDQAWAFLDQAADRLLLDGIGVVLPPDLVGTDLLLRLRLGEDGVAAGAPAAALLEPDGLARLAGIRHDGVDPGAIPGPFDGLLAGFRWEAALGDDALTPEEFRVLVQAKAPLVRVRERWVRIDSQRLRRLERLGPPGELPLADALALGLAGSAAEIAGVSMDPGGEELAEPIEVAISGGLGELIDRLRAAGERPPVEAAPPGFDGELRPYQRRGVAWLQGMGELGLGAVLADEMGLGKTPTLIAHLLLRDGGGGPHLVVCPTSVVGNWEREFNRFAPTATVSRHHGADRPDRLEGVKGVLLTTYGTLRRDAELLAGVEWDTVTLDEAQQVKNPGTVGARAVRRLRSRQTVALTGTPLENRLAELWSLLDATNPGLLGSRARFGRRFTAPIEQRQDAEVARRLRRLVGPFILRREKRDPGILADLPEKIERTVVCPLTPEQA
ncbi:MAG: hypothetical protein GEU81_16660, partial [Nitriliruptorales bacterium]|nr:hypothetical protein [Nitriliruptorales bacterium]